MFSVHIELAETGTGRDTAAHRGHRRRRIGHPPREILVLTNTRSWPTLLLLLLLLLLLTSMALFSVFNLRKIMQKKPLGRDANLWLSRTLEGHRTEFIIILSPF